jgi:hypothetical protein
MRSGADSPAHCPEYPKDGTHHNEDGADRVEQTDVEQHRKQKQNYSGDNHSLPFEV